MLRHDAVIVLDGYLHADEAAALVVIGDVLGMQAELAQQQQRQTQAEQQQQLQQEQEPEQEDKQEEQEHERQQGEP
jgi:flagellar biosynthesis component FlhA